MSDSSVFKNDDALENDKSSRLPGVICVGATNRDYGRPAFTNYGSNLTIFAPGELINSSTINPDYPYYPQSGTSQAAPHVAGVVANFIAFEGINNDASLVRSRLIENAQSGVLSKYMGEGSPDLLANYGMANPRRNPQYPYAGPQKELARDNSAIDHVSGPTLTMTTAPFPVIDGSSTLLPSPTQPTTSVLCVTPPPQLGLPRCILQ